MRIITTLFLTLALAFFLIPAWGVAQEPSEPRRVLEAGINTVLADLQDPKLRTQDGREAVLKRVERTISELFDFRELSARAVGPNWKNFTPDQQTRLVDNFTTLLRETYLEKFDAYNGEQVEYTNELISTNGKRAEIQTNIVMKKNTVPINYRLINKGSWAVYDVNIEGVSLIQNFRSQFQSVLMKGNIEQLIDLVAQKAEETRNANKKQGE